MSTLTPDAELELCRRAQSSVAAERDQAFARIFEHLRGPIFSLCLHLTGRRSEAEDALQETFLAIHQGLPSFRGEARVGTWAYRIAVRAALEVRARRRASSSLDEASGAPAPGPDPEATATSREALARLMGALEQLSGEHRLVLSLFAVEGLDHAEIARILGVPEGTVWSRLHNARKRLAATLDPR